MIQIKNISAIIIGLGGVVVVTINNFKTEEINKEKMKRTITVGDIIFNTLNIELKTIDVLDFAFCFKNWLSSDKDFEYHSIEDLGNILFSIENISKDKYKIKCDGKSFEMNKSDIVGTYRDLSKTLLVQLKKYATREVYNLFKKELQY